MIALTRWAGGRFFVRVAAAPEAPLGERHRCWFGGLRHGEVRRRKLILVRYWSLSLSVKPAISVCWRQGKTENAEWLGSRLVYVQFGRVFVVVLHASSV